MLLRGRFEGTSLQLPSALTRAFYERLPRAGCQRALRRLGPRPASRRAPRRCRRRRSLADPIAGASRVSGRTTDEARRPFAEVFSLRSLRRLAPRGPLSLRSAPIARARAHDPETPPLEPEEATTPVEEIVVAGRHDSLVGIADSASEGTVGAEQLERRPLTAPGRGARDRARPDPHAAQRRRQGEPVLPARLQPRPRHRLRDVDRRRAGEPARRTATARATPT